ncbi:MAG: Holliday junction branch migration protein RuvA [Clostridiales bacterium]|nr:Holliday junction branch migration protein RuvA [Clostridiales bacterium]
MYSFITGIIEEKYENLIVLNNNGIGYEIIVSTNTVDRTQGIGDEAKLYTYLHVREDAMQLFGFYNKQEKDVFLSLISVSGIGAKTAIQMLSSLSASEIVTAIMYGDVKLIASIKGIGKKTAERILLELKNSINTLNGITLENYTEFSNTSSGNESAMEEAANLMVDMGLSKVEAMKLIKSVAGPDDTTEILVTKALRNMN